MRRMGVRLLRGVAHPAGQRVTFMSPLQNVVKPAGQSVGGVTAGQRVRACAGLVPLHLPLPGPLVTSVCPMHKVVRLMRGVAAGQPAGQRARAGLVLLHLPLPGALKVVKSAG